MNGLASSFIVIFLRLMLRSLLVMGLLDFWGNRLGLLYISSSSYALLVLRAILQYFERIR